jgi:hypothetical protein
MTSFIKKYIYILKDCSIILIFTSILLLLLGIYYTHELTVENFENKKSHINIDIECPDMLIHHGNNYFLYNSFLDIEAGINPIKFRNLHDYTKFVETNNKKCPVIFLQYSTDIQNKELLYIKPDFLTNHADLLNKKIENHKTKTSNTIDHPDLLDATKRNKYNHNLYPGFDAYNQTIGIKTSLDHKFNSTDKISPNPMDTNWGGHEYTTERIEKGDYKDRTRSIKNDKP